MATSVRNAGWMRNIWLLPVLLVLSACLDHHEWKQKQTIVVDTTSGEVSGSSVVQIKAAFGRQPLTENEVWYKVIGEATAVEVAPGRYLFALLNGSEERFYWAIRDRIETSRRGEWLKIIPKMNDVALLNPEYHGYPKLVTFLDIENPKTARWVDPENLAASFGPGFRLKEITLEITDEPVTTGVVESLLKWLQDPGVMNNPGWTKLPKESRMAIRSLLSHYPKLGDE